MDHDTTQTQYVSSRRTAHPAYLKIAYDIARRISCQELPVGTRLFGRSLMSSEYGVSPETIRRALSLLSEKQIVEIHRNSGVSVLSKEKADTYIREASKDTENRVLLSHLYDLLEQQKKLSQEISSTVHSLTRSLSRKSADLFPYHTYEVTIQEGAVLCGKTLSDVEFWGKTHATVIAIRRQGHIHLSPGPDISLEADDVLVLVGHEDHGEALEALTRA